MAVPTTREMSDGFEIPLVGFGTYDIHGDDAYSSVRTALDIGYRHIDTAFGYRNEAEIGQALQDCKINRESIFITTKVPPRQAGKEAATLEASLKQLRTDYLDLWLIHAPPSMEYIPVMWELFIAARERGLVRSIGVSNFSLQQIDAVIATTGTTPVVNQIRWTPELYDERMIRGCESRKIVIEGFSGIRRTDLNDPTLVKIAKAHNVTSAQVVLRWHLEHGIAILPRSTKPSRIEENFDLWGFELSADEVAVIDTMSLVN